MRVNTNLMILQIAVLALVSVAAAALHRSLIKDLPPVRLVTEGTGATQPSGGMESQPADSTQAHNPATDNPEVNPVHPEEVGASDRVMVARITPAQAFEYYEEGLAQFADARNFADYEESRIPGAFHLPFSAFGSGKPKALGELIPEVPTVVYCEGGDCESSLLVAQQLLILGFSELKLIESGFPGWIEAGYPIREGAEP